MSKRRHKNRNDNCGCGCCSSCCGGCECTEDYCCSDKLLHSQSGYQWLLLLYVFGSLQRESCLEQSMAQANERLMCAYIEQNQCLNANLMDMLNECQNSCRNTNLRLLDTQELLLLDPDRCRDCNSCKKCFS